MFESAAAVIAVSQRMGGDLIRLGCPEARLRLCPYGPHPDFFQVEPGSNSNTVVAIGRLTPKKAPHLTILAFAQALQACPDLRLVVIGDGELRGVCRDLIESLHLADKVEIRGVATHEEVRRRLADAFLFVQHSVQADDGDCEGTPLAVLEAGAAGLPVLATRHAGIPDVVMEGETGLLVDERDVDAMSRQLVRLASDRGLARRLGQRARQHIAENFSMQRHIDSLSQVLEEALQPSPTQ
jgi:glycosyltransferase involved in cell wall biosynthesis